MRVVLADQDVAWLSKMHQAVSRISGIAVVGVATGVRESVAMINNRRPEIVILSTTLADGAGIDALRQIKQLTIPPTVVMASSDMSPEYQSSCSEAGADFFFDKETERRKIVNAVRLLAGLKDTEPLTDLPAVEF